MKKVSEIVREKSDKRIKDNLADNPGLFFFNYSGVSAADLNFLRRNLKNVGAKMFVAKNSFINVSLKDLDNQEELSKAVDGPTALIFVSDDPIGPSKVLTEFAKTHESMKLRGGYVRDRLLKATDFKMLANIPPREVLYQQIASVFNAPMSKLAMSLNQIVTKLAYALKAISEKKDKK